MIELRKIEKTYIDKNKHVVKALKDISLNFNDNGLVFIVGKSGSGKSTLLNVIGGIDSPTAGEIISDKQSLCNFSKSEKTRNIYRNKHVGFIFQEYNLLPDYDVGSNIGLALELQHKKVNKEQIEGILKSLDLVDDEGNTLIKRKIKELSGGQKQRVAIARVLVKNPDIILADEPTGALDAESSVGLYRILKQISKDKLVIVVSHDLENANKFADRIIELSSGAIKNDSAPVSSEVKELLFEKEKENAKEKKVGFPFFKAFKLALSSLISKPLKLIFSTLIAVLSCSLFCFSLVVGTTDIVDAELKSCYENNVRYAVISQNSRIDGFIDYKDGTFKNFSSDDDGGLTEKQISTLLDNNDLTTTKTAHATLISDRFGYNNFSREMTDEEYFNPYNWLAGGGFSRIVEINNESDFCLTQDSRLTIQGKIPTSVNEIAITDYWADMFIRFGYKDSLTELVENITSVDQLIGKKLEGNFTICGIYKTEEDISYLKKYDHNSNDETITDEYLDLYLRGEHFMNYAFLCNDFIKLNFSSNESIDILYKLKGNLYQDKKTLSLITYTYEETFTDSIEPWINHYTYNKSGTYLTRYSGFEITTDTLRSPECVKVLFIISGVLALLSSLILLNYFNNCLDAKKHTFGILRALGASRFDLNKIFITESFLTSVIYFVLSLLTTGIVCTIINKQFNFWMFNLGIISIFSLLGLCLLISMIASLLPTIQLGRKKPAEIIRNNQ